MNRYLMLRRLRGPVFLLLVGINAFLAQAHILGWHKSWPLYLILFGVFLLAERAALANSDSDAQMPYTGTGAVNPPPYGESYSPADTSTSIVPVHTELTHTEKDDSDIPEGLR